MISLRLCEINVYIRNFHRNLSSTQAFQSLCLRRLYFKLNYFQLFQFMRSRSGEKRKNFQVMHLSIRFWSCFRNRFLSEVENSAVRIILRKTLDLAQYLPLDLSMLFWQVSSKTNNCSKVGMHVGDLKTTCNEPLELKSQTTSLNGKLTYANVLCFNIIVKVEC